MATDKPVPENLDKKGRIRLNKRERGIEENSHSLIHGIRMSVHKTGSDPCVRLLECASQSQTLIDISSLPVDTMDVVGCAVKHRG